MTLIIISLDDLFIFMLLFFKYSNKYIVKKIYFFNFFILKYKIIFDINFCLI